MKKTIILAREDLNNPLFPTLFDDLLEQLGITPEASIETVTLVVSAAYAE